MQTGTAHFQSVLGHIQAIVRKKGKIVIVGWKDHNHITITRALAAAEIVVFTEQASTNYSVNNLYIFTTSVRSSLPDQARSKGARVPCDELDIATIHQLLIPLAENFLSLSATRNSGNGHASEEIPKTPTTTKSTPVTVARLQPVVVAVSAPAKSASITPEPFLPAKAHYESLTHGNDKKNKPPKIPPTTRRKTVSTSTRTLKKRSKGRRTNSNGNHGGEAERRRFATEFLSAAEEFPNGCLSSRMTKDLGIRLLRQNPQALTRAGLIEGIAKKEGGNVGLYKATPALRKLAGGSKQKRTNLVSKRVTTKLEENDEPRDVLEKVRWLSDNLPHFRANYSRLLKEAASAKKLVVRATTATRMLKNLTKLAKV